MSWKVGSKRGNRKSRPGFLEPLLILWAAFLLVLAIGWVVGVFLIDQMSLLAVRVVLGIAGMVLMLAFSTVAWALADILSGRRGMEEKLARLRAASQATGAASGAATEKGHLQQEILERLDEIRKLALMPEDQRNALREGELAVWRERIGGRIEQALSAGQWQQAEELLVHYDDKVGQDESYQRWNVQLEDRRKEVSQKEKRRGMDHVESLMSAGKFDEAEKAVESLGQSLGFDDELEQLEWRIQRERQAYQQEQIQRLYRQVQTQAKKRNWQDALEAAQKLQGAYPESAEAKLVEVIRETLRENARLQQVRQIRDRIRDLIGRKRYAEALELARQVVRDYPETAAAQELREQMERLEQRAAQQE
jgi:tetratricopeptide (TPR) repeat protein